MYEKQCAINAHFISCFANSCNLIKILKRYLNIFVRNFVLCIQIRFVSTEKTTRIASRASCLVSNATSLCQVGQISFSVLFNSEWCTPRWYPISKIVCLVHERTIWSPFIVQGWLLYR